MKLFSELRKALRKPQEESVWDIFLAFYPNRKGIRCPNDSALPPAWEYKGSKPTPLYRCRTCGGHYNLYELLERDAKRKVEFERDLLRKGLPKERR